MADINTHAYAEDDELDTELAEVLTAISVVSRRLAKKITAKQMSKEDKKYVQELRTDGRDRQSKT
jgi:hypothetical protein